MTRPTTLTLPVRFAGWWLDPIPVLDWMRLGFAYEHEIRPEEVVTIPAQALARLLSLARDAIEWRNECESEGVWEDDIQVRDAMLVGGIGSMVLSAPRAPERGEGR